MRAVHPHPGALLSHGSPQVRPPLETRRSGVALIIVLGLLAVLLVAAVALMRSVRTTQQATRNVLDDLRARQLVHAALARALVSVNEDTRGYTYPYWNHGAAHDATGSTNGTSACRDLLSGEAAGYIPLALWNDAEHVSTNVCQWITVTPEPGNSQGRIAYVIVNCSGLLDANYFGVTNPVPSRDSRRELDISGLPDFRDVSSFLAGRELAARYESLPELQRLADGLGAPISNVFILSHDPGWSSYPTGSNALGQVLPIALTNKFAVNIFWNFTNGATVDCYKSDPTFHPTYFDPLTNHLAMAGISNRVDDIAWNIVNYLDSDRIPQTDSTAPWLNDDGVEAVPLINEIMLQEKAGATNRYEFVVELWYPFFPIEVTPSDTFELQVAVVGSDPGASACESSGDLTAYGSPAWSFKAPIGSMRFGDATEFLCFTSPTISFGTNDPPIGGANRVWMAARVVKDGIPVDHAMNANGFTCFDSVRAYAVNDPRMNGSTNNWIALTNATPGMMNAGCDPWPVGGQGLPIQHQDGLITSIGMLGYVYAGRPWCSLDLMDWDNGAGLPDYLTAIGDPPSRGYLCGSSRQTPVLETLFHGVTLGLTNSATASSRTMTPDEERNLAMAFDGPNPSISSKPFLNFRDMLSEIGRTTNYLGWKPDTLHATGDMKEDAFRENLEWLSFRQNIFTIILAAQSFAKDHATVVAEKRAVAVVYRDSYTGRTRLCYFKWLGE